MKEFEVIMCKFSLLLNVVSCQEQALEMVA